MKHLSTYSLVLLLPGWALAQKATGDADLSAYTGGNIAIEFQSPNASTLRVDCNSDTDDNCKPLNRVACGEVSDPTTARKIQIALTKTAVFSTVAGGGNLYVWFQKATDLSFKNDHCVFSQVPADKDLIQTTQPYSMSASSDFLQGQTVQFPGDIASSLQYTTANLLQRDDACSTAGIQKQIYRLCFAMAVNNATKIDATPATPRAWVYFEVDTRAPPKPEQPAIKALDGRLEITLKPSGDSSSATSDLTRYWVYFKEANDPETTPSCSELQTENPTKLNGAGDATITGTISVENGKTYFLCAIAVDAMGNRSEGSDVVKATPQDECDFIECYPGEPFDTSYCGSFKPNIFLAGLVFLWLIRQRSNRWTFQNIFRDRP